MTVEEQEFQKFKVTYLLNCAVLIDYGKGKVLVDGLFSGKQPFDIMDPAMEHRIIHGEGEFSELRYVIATHCHNDHYNGSKIIECAKHNPGITIIVPSNAKLDADRLEGVEANIFYMNEDVDIRQVLEFPDIMVEYFKSEHLTYKYPEHYCVNVVGRRSNVLLTADMKLSRVRKLKGLIQREDSWIFVNSIMLWHERWRQNLLDLRYRHIVFYHVASASRDSWGFRAKAIRYWTRFSGEFPNGVLAGYNQDYQSELTS